MTNDRVLVWTPTGRDAALACGLLEHHRIPCKPLLSVYEVIAAMPSAGCAIVATEALDPETRAVIEATLAAQPPWSDFPFILLAPSGTRTGSAADADRANRVLGNVTLLERPVRARTLLSAVAAARRARLRQYEAREAIHQRDQFLAMLGHELRNPLAAIILALDIGGDRAKQQRVIDRQARHLARLVDDLLDVARVTTGKVTLQLDDVDLADILHRCIQGSELAAHTRSIRLHCELEREQLPVRGDAVRLEEIFNNLLTNALKYSPEGSRVDVKGRIDGDHCVVDVSDTGVGIAADMLPRIFDLFTQVDGSLARSQGGLGIGLTLVRSLVELHGGTVIAESTGLGHGSSFTVRIPRARSLPAAPHLTLVPAAPALRIVLVDDNQDILEMTADALRLLGCTVFLAADGPSGVEAIAEHTPDLAIVDIGLPGMDGYEVARAVKRLAQVPYLVALTGYGQVSDRERALAAGFDEYFVKPIAIARLRELFLRAKPAPPHPHHRYQVAVGGRGAGGPESRGRRRSDDDS